MKTAIDFYARGKQKESNANEYDRRMVYSRTRFICPECGEAVYLTGSKYSNHFSHYKKTDSSSECDRRVDGVPTDSVYERVGLPIFMRRNASGDFNLYMGFKALPAVLMDRAIKEHMVVKIDGKRSYTINQERFSMETTSFLPLDHIPMYGAKYRVSYEPVMASYMISRHWSDYADGFSFDGALFTVTEQGGKKIRHGDSVTCGVEYYWVRRNSVLPSFVQGIQMEKVGRLLIKDGNFIVFKGCFSPSISDTEFNALSAYLRESIKVHLLEKQPEFVPIWPPVVRREDGYMVEEHNRHIYGHIISGNETPKIYSYQGVNAIPDELSADDSVAKITFYDRFVLVNIDRKYVSNGTLLERGKLKEYSHDIEIYEVENKILISEMMEIKIDKTSLRLQSKHTAEMILVRTSGIIEKREGINVFEFSSLCNGDLIYILKSNYLVSIILIVTQAGTVENKKILKNNVELQELFQKFKHVRKVYLPRKIRFKLMTYSNSSELLFIEIEHVLKENKIALPLIKILEATEDV